MSEVVRRSRFSATLGPAPDPDGAQAFIRSVRQSFPDATHHAWAYVVGPPASTAQVGMSDDGEPHGIAGRPILNVLLHSGIGDVVAVITRYFGGVKLGMGGLSRAYAGVVARGIEALPTIDRARIGRFCSLPRAAFASSFCRNGCRGTRSSISGSPYSCCCHWL